MKWVSLIPLIGGLSIAMEDVFGCPPMAVISAPEFKDNDSHLLEYYSNRFLNIPYLGMEWAPSNVDIVGAIPPCAGLSSLSKDYGSFNPHNDWLIKATDYTLSDIKPKVFWGENSPHLAGNVGAPVRSKLKSIAEKNGYSSFYYRTSSHMHGLAQVRERTFFFFFKGKEIPVFKNFNMAPGNISDLLMQEPEWCDPMNQPINKNIPSEHPSYQYVLEEMHSGVSHEKFSRELNWTPPSVRDADIYSYIESNHPNLKDIVFWMKSKGYDEEAKKWEYRIDKLNSGKNLMYRGPVIPADLIGAFVGHYPKMLTHPIEDRFITYREALNIMGMPNDFMLLKPSQSYNHICQNVPVQTAKHMAQEIVAFLDNKRVTLPIDFAIQHNSKEQTLGEFFE